MFQSKKEREQKQELNLWLTWLNLHMQMSDAFWSRQETTKSWKTKACMYFWTQDIGPVLLYIIVDCTNKENKYLSRNKDRGGERRLSKFTLPGWCCIVDLCLNIFFSS